MEIPNEALLNQFKFPVDKKGLSEEQNEHRQKIALSFLSSISYEKMLSARGNNRELAIRAAFAWADAFLGYKCEEDEEVLEID